MFFLFVESGILVFFYSSDVFLLKYVISIKVVLWEFGVEMEGILEYIEKIFFKLMIGFVLVE